jgi:hypothetical protein
MFHHLSMTEGLRLDGSLLGSDKTIELNRDKPTKEGILQAQERKIFAGNHIIGVDGV